MAIPLVAVFLALNAVVVVVGLVDVVRPRRCAVGAGRDALTADGGGLGGVARPGGAGVPAAGARAVRVRDRGEHDAAGRAPTGDDREERLRSRIRNTRKLLTAAALIMSGLPDRHQLRHHRADPAGGVRSRAARPTAGRWPTSRTSCSARRSAPSTTSAAILILWFAGASAMAGLINIVPRYLPGYGMAPEWGAGGAAGGARLHRDLRSSSRSLFGADVNAQAGAYATGILAMMVSGGVRGDRLRAAPPAARRPPSGSAVLTLVLLYALVENIVEKPDGIAISAVFIAGIIVVSLISRVGPDHRAARRRASSSTRPRAGSSPTALAHDGAAAHHRQQAPGRRRRPSTRPRSRAARR